MADTATARAFWTLSPGRGEIRHEALAAPDPGAVRVRATYSGVSRGTESLVFGGHVPKSLHATMRAPFQAGDFSGPVKYGYMSVGTVEAGPPEAVGRPIFCLHPHQDRYTVPVEAAVPIPAGVPLRRAVLAANLETALNGLWDAPPLAGDRIAVVGCGVVGGMAAALAARVPGVEIELVDPSPHRKALADALGLPLVAAEDARPGADLVIHASGTASGLATALRLAGDEATVLELSWYGAEPVPAPLGEWFHVRRLRIVSSQVGKVAPPKRPRWSHRRRLELALRLLADPVFDAFLTGESAFADMPQTMQRLAAAGGDVLCHVIRYED